MSRRRFPNLSSHVPYNRQRLPCYTPRGYHLWSEQIGVDGKPGYWCITCMRWLPDIQFGERRDRKWQLNNPERKAIYMAQYRRRRKYGLSPEQFGAMVAAQASKCAVCLQWTKKLVVDHDHASGRVRGLLCRGCNHALGNLRDNYEIAANATIYLYGDRGGVHWFRSKKRSA